MNEEKINEKPKLKVSENFQSIYTFRKPMITTLYGKKRVMEEIGVIKGLSLEKSKNYILIPIKNNDNNSAWTIYALPSDHKAEPESYKNLHTEEEYTD